jgi:hypothetical protein
MEQENPTDVYSPIQSEKSIILELIIHSLRKLEIFGGASRKLEIVRGFIFTVRKSGECWTFLPFQLGSYRIFKVLHQSGN